MIYTHVLQRGALGVRIPLDRLAAPTGAESRPRACSALSCGGCCVATPRVRVQVVVHDRLRPPNASPLLARDAASSAGL